MRSLLRAVIIEERLLLFSLFSQFFSDLIPGRGWKSKRC